VNTTSRKFRQYLLDNGSKDTLIRGPSQGLTVTLAGGNVMRVSGDKARILVEVKLATHNVVEEQDILILGEDSENLVMDISVSSGTVSYWKVWVKVSSDSWMSMRTLVICPNRFVLVKTRLEIIAKWRIPHWKCFRSDLTKHGSSVILTLISPNWTD
jgi:hypothetical protein